MVNMILMPIKFLTLSVFGLFLSIVFDREYQCKAILKLNTNKSVKYYDVKYLTDSS